MKTLIYTLITMLFLALSVKAQEPAVQLPSVSSNAGIPRADTIEIQPEFPGGVNAFYSFINKKFRMPNVKEDMTARIVVSYVVEKDGTMSSYEILKDPGYGMGEQVIRILKSVKEKWKPGMQDGISVRASYVLPITINIKS